MHLLALLMLFLNGKGAGQLFIGFYLFALLVLWIFYILWFRFIRPPGENLLQDYKLKMLDGKLIFGAWPGKYVELLLSRVGYVRETKFGLQVFGDRKRIWIPNIVKGYGSLKKNFDPAVLSKTRFSLNNPLFSSASWLLFVVAGLFFYGTKLIEDPFVLANIAIIVSANVIFAWM